MEISPLYKIKLAKKVSEKIWEELSGYESVLAYIKQWQQEFYDGFSLSANFEIEYKSVERKQIDLLATLHKMDGETLIKVAIDIGVETPDFIPSIPVFRNEIKDSYRNASEVFEKAFKDVEKDPALAIGLSNSALESIIKDINKQEGIEGYNESDALSKQANSLYRHFNTRFPKETVPPEIRNISSSILNASKAIEDLRSDKTWFHGKSSGETIICNPLFAYFIINATATVGLFLLNYFKKESEIAANSYDDLPF